MSTSERARVMHDALARVAPGTPLREGLDRIVRAKTGALVVLGDGPDVLSICSGGFLLDSPFSPQRLSELAKMDGAIIVAPDASRIARANVHLVPDPGVPTSETGTRHRTAERVARSLGVPVVSVSEEMGVISVYVGDSKRGLQEIARVLDRANQALQTLERYKTRLDDITASFAALEIEDLVTLRDVATVLQRSEMVNRISDEIDMMIVELGVDARLLRLQLEELSGATDVDLDLVIRDYLPAGDTRKAVDVMHELQILPDEELLDLRVVAATFLPETPGLELDHGLQPRGYRLLAKVPRLTSEQAEGVVARFGSLATLMRAAVADLADVPGIDVARAEAIKDSLARLAESSILDQYM